MVEMNVVGVAVEPNTNRPLVWLKDREQQIFLPISIGNFEATAIYMALYDEEPPQAAHLRVAPVHFKWDGRQGHAGAHQRA